MAAGINCQLFPTSDQFRCYVNYLTNNPNDENVQAIIANCDTLSNPMASCSSEVCLDAVDRIFKDRCGFANNRAGELVFKL